MSKEKPNIKFGTDGWRGIIADNFTFQNLSLVTQAIAEYLKDALPNKKGLKIVVGYDTRFLSDRFAAAVAEVLSGNDISVLLSDKAIPTPVVSFVTEQRKLSLGIMITASHNPPYFNGLKIKTASGAAAGSELTSEVESRIKTSMDIPKANNDLIQKEDLTADYVKYLRNYIDIKKLKDKKFKVLVDLMYGSGNGFIEEVLKGTKITFEYLRGDYNPSFGGKGPEPVQRNLTKLKEETKEGGFDIGLALDGDADRIAASRDDGVFLHPQIILPALLLHLAEDRGFKGGVVKTLVGTTLINKVAEKLGIKVFETPVGFKYISKHMEEDDIIIGGEEAGGIGFKNYIPERDGTLAGLLLIELMASKGKAISAIIKDIHKEFGEFYYVRADLKLSKKDYTAQFNKFKTQKELLGKKVVDVKDFDGVKLTCEDESWLVLRGSGTEPLMRVYAEASTLRRAEQLRELGKKIALS